MILFSSFCLLSVLRFSIFKTIYIFSSNFAVHSQQSTINSQQPTVNTLPVHMISCIFLLIILPQFTVHSSRLYIYSIFSFCLLVHPESGYASSVDGFSWCLSAFVFSSSLTNTRISHTLDQIYYVYVLLTLLLNDIILFLLRFVQIIIYIVSHSHVLSLGSTHLLCASASSIFISTSC